MPEMKVNGVQKLFPPIECRVLKTGNRSRWISVNLDDLKHDRFEEVKASVVATVELADPDFDRLCYRGLNSHDYPFVSQVYGRKRKILKNEAGRDEFEVIRIENEKMDWLYMAVRQYGSIENFTKAMKENFQNYLSEGPVISENEVDGIMEKTELLTKRLTADLTRDPSSAEVQAAVSELIAFCEESNRGIDMGENYWLLTAEAYQSNPVYLEVNDRKYGEGASKFIGSAIKEYLDRK